MQRIDVETQQEQCGTQRLAYNSWHCCWYDREDPKLILAIVIAHFANALLGELFAVRIFWHIYRKFHAPARSVRTQSIGMRFNFNILSIIHVMCVYARYDVCNCFMHLVHEFLPSICAVYMQFVQYCCLLALGIPVSTLRRNDEFWSDFWSGRRWFSSRPKRATCLWLKNFQVEVTAMIARFSFRTHAHPLHKFQKF